MALAQLTDRKLLALELGSDLTIRETKLLGSTQGVGGDVLFSERLKGLFHLHETSKLVEEPLVNLGHFPNLVNSVTFAHSIGNSKDTTIRGHSEFTLNLIIIDNGVL